jgi:hypothetical protein
MFSVSRAGIFTTLLCRATTIAATFSSRPAKLFAYDEMMSAERLGDYRVISYRSVVAFVEDHELAVVAATGERGVGAASIMRNVGEKVFGVLHEITALELVALDILAASCGYARRLVDVVDVNGIEERAWVFVARRLKRGLKCRASYKDDLVEVAVKCGLPRFYVEHLMTIPCVPPLPQVQVKSRDAPASACTLALSSGH